MYKEVYLVRTEQFKERTYYLNSIRDIVEAVDNDKELVDEDFSNVQLIQYQGIIYIE